MGGHGCPTKRQYQVLIRPPLCVCKSVLGTMGQNRVYRLDVNNCQREKVRNYKQSTHGPWGLAEEAYYKLYKLYTNILLLL